MNTKEKHTVDADIKYAKGLLGHFEDEGDMQSASVMLRLTKRLQHFEALREACKFALQYLEIQEVSDSKLGKDLKQALTNSEDR